MKYAVIFFNNYTEQEELFGTYATEEAAWEATEGSPELDFWVYKLV